MSAGLAARERRSRRGHALLLRAFPRSFRERHGPAMTATFMEAWRVVADAPLRTRALFWTRTASDHVVQGLAVRMSGGGVLQASRATGVGFATDLLLAVRALRRAPGFVALVVVTLALGIGANVAVLSLFDAVLLHPLPVAEPEHLFAVHEALGPAARRGGVAYPTYRDLRGAPTGLAGLAAYFDDDLELEEEGRVERTEVSVVSGDYFRVLGLEPQRGRLLVPTDETGSDPAVVVLSDGLWRRRFGADPGAVGSTVHLNGTPVTVVGVAPRGFRGVSLGSDVELWIPLPLAPRIARDGIFAAEDALTHRGLKILNVVARVGDGVTPSMLQERLDRSRLAADAESVADG